MMILCDSPEEVFQLFGHWYAAMEDLTCEERCRLYEAAILYALGHTPSGLDPILSMAFKFIKEDIDEIIDK